MDIWIVWLIVALLLVVVEVLTQMVWTLCLAVGCIGALVADLLGVELPWQVAVMAFTSVVAFLVLMPLFKRWHDRSSGSCDSNAATGMEALLGRRTVVTHDIEPGGLGRVRIDGDNWQVRCSGSQSVIPAGRDVVVVAFDGNILDVEIAAVTD